MGFNPDDIVIVAAKRTPIGNFQGQLSTKPAPELAAATVKAIINETQLAPDIIESAIYGCVLPAGLKQAPARQAIRLAGLADNIEATTINKMCGSGLKAVMLAHDAIKAHTNKIVICGGMENMSLAPYLLPKARGGYRMGHGKILDHMFTDGLEDAYEGQLMGYYADKTAEQYKISRQAQDDFAITSVERAQQSMNSGLFKNEIVPITIQSKKSTTEICHDEGPKTARPEKIPLLKPAFSDEGTVTAANASSISDGAASLLLMTHQDAQHYGLKSLARILGHATHAKKPVEFTTAPIGAATKLLSQLQLSADDIDLFEVNEAFAVVTLALMKELNIEHGKVNIHGGACVLGHPVGASGARILCTLLHSLEHYDKHLGLATLCIGGGEAVAVVIERNKA